MDAYNTMEQDPEKMVMVNFMVVCSIHHMKKEILDLHIVLIKGITDYGEVSSEEEWMTRKKNPGYLKEKKFR